MATFSAQILSGSTNGKPIVVAATTASGTLLHTAVTGTVSYDELIIYASNVSTAAVNLTIEFGGTSSPGDHLVTALSIPANCPPIPVATGQRLNNGLVVRAYASVASVINITGAVNRVT